MKFVADAWVSMKPPTKTKSSPDAAGAGLPLPTLLSHVLVAFTIEFDNEAERQIRHRTTKRGLSKDRSSKHDSTADMRHAPWLVSRVMWSNCMQFVGGGGRRFPSPRHCRILPMVLHRGGYPDGR